MVNHIFFETYMVQSQKSMTFGYPHWLSLNDITGLTLPTPDLWFVLFIRTCKTQQLWETSFNGYTDVLIAGTFCHNGCTSLITRTINKQYVTEGVLLSQLSRLTCSVE